MSSSEDCPRSCLRRSSCLFFALAVTFLSVEAGVVSRQPATDPFHQHVRRVSQFPCRRPQPRSVSSRELLQERVSLTTYEDIYPAMTVLHRCDSGSGCCMGGDHLACAPLDQEEVDLTFRLLDVMGEGARLVTVKTTNHTMCSCKHVNEVNDQSS